jgi:hypothetical protein
VISSISPVSLQAGATNQQLSITGKNFVQASQVRYNGRGLPTTYVSATALTAVVTSDLITVLGQAAISVTNPPDVLSLPFIIAILGQFSASPGGLKFQSTEGSTQPLDQVVQLYSSSVPASFIVSTTSDSWLQVSSVGGHLPALLHVMVNPAGLSAGTTYVSNLNIQSPGNNTLSIPVTLSIIHPSAPFTVTAPPLQFTVTSSQPASTVPAQLAIVTNQSSQSLTLPVSTAGGSSWLTVLPRQLIVGPGQSAPITVQVTPSALAAGVVNSDSVLVGSGAQAVQAPVSAIVSDGSIPRPVFSASAQGVIRQLTRRGSPGTDIEPSLPTCLLAVRIRPAGGPSVVWIVNEIRISQQPDGLRIPTSTDASRIRGIPETPEMTASADDDSVAAERWS